MELWIRSQDKKRLTKIEDVYMVEDEDGKDNILSFPKYYIGNTLVGHLGVYKSKERALEVLDEIQNILEPLLIVKNCTNKEEKQKASEMCNISDFIGTSNDCDIHLLSNTYVYEMPIE